ncbi:MAG TPA: ABC transporter substrate-binding protein [Armatimonadota bacterium]|jgi:iron complex transport system substrate-binding protein
MRMGKHGVIILALAAVLVGILLIPRYGWDGHGQQRGWRLGASQQDFPLTVTDALGRTVTIPTRPERLISLAPNITEILFAIGAGPRVVADTAYCDYPPAAAALPKIGGYLDPNLEKVLALKPDLVLCDDINRHAMVDRLAGLGIPVVMSAPERLQEVEGAIRQIGRAVGEASHAETLADDLQRRRAAVTAKTAALPEASRPRTLFLFSLDGFYSAGPGSYIDELIRYGGGRNIITKPAAAWPQLAIESIVAADPQVIILLAKYGKQHHLTAAVALATLLADRRWRDITAVKTRRVVVLDDDPMTLPGPRLIEGLESTAGALHPEWAVPRRP